MRSQHERTFCDDDRLWVELERPESERKQAALRALDALAELAMLRASADGMTYRDARREVYRCALLEADLKKTDAPIRAAAIRVRDEVDHLDALRTEAAGGGCLTDDERRVPRRIWAWVCQRLAEMRRHAARNPAQVEE